MKVLVTGGAGYIGSELAGHLLNAGHRVHVLDNLMYGGDSLLRYASNPDFSFERFDVRNSMKEKIKGYDYIIPLAALVGFPLCDKDPSGATLINDISISNIAHFKEDWQRIIYPCTNSGYGLSDGVCTEESPLNPVSLYGLTKVAAEKSVKSVPNHVTFRLATVFGASSRMRTDLLVNNFTWKALKDRTLVLYECEFMRNYVHIQDVCRAFMHVVENWVFCKDETYNVGHDGINMNKLQLAETIKKYLPVEIVKAEFNTDPDVRDYVVSSQKFYDRGFKCKYDLDYGIQELLRAYKIIDNPHYGNY